MGCLAAGLVFTRSVSFSSTQPRSSLSSRGPSTLPSGRRRPGVAVICRAAVAGELPSVLCVDDDAAYMRWAESNGAAFPKVQLRGGEARLRRGAVAAAPLEPLEVIASFPRRLVLASDAGPGWAARLTEAALAAKFAAPGSPASPLRPWVAGWRGGGWATEADDLHPRDREGVTGGSLLTTGSDNDVEIYRKFALPCHPVVDRAAMVLAGLSNASLAAARAALRTRGFAFRACRDRLAPLVALDEVPPGDEPAATLSPRERRNLQVARCFSQVLARAERMDDGESVAVAPLHELLEHCGEPGAANTRLLSADPCAEAAAAASDHVVLVATRAIAAGEALTRDFGRAPRLAAAPPPADPPSGGSVTKPPGEDDAALQLLLQSGILPAAAA